jgi:hypothetical protein
MLNDNEKKALQAQLDEIKQWGSRNIGYYWEVFKKLDHAVMFERLQDAIDGGLLGGKLKTDNLMDFALDWYLFGLFPDNEDDLKDFANFNDCFMNYSTYTVVLEELEKNN